MSTESSELRPDDMMGAMADRLEANLDVLADTGADAASSETWMASEQKRVFLLCRRMLQDAEEADSATQDTFLKAWQALKRPESKTLDDPGQVAHPDRRQYLPGPPALAPLAILAKTPQGRGRIGHIEPGRGYRPRTPRTSSSPARSLNGSHARSNGSASASAPRSH